MNVKDLFEYNMVHFEEVPNTEEAPLPKGVIMRIRGGAHSSGKVTQNATLYPTELYQREATNLSPLMSGGEVLMYPRHPKIFKNEKGEVSVESLSPQDATGLLRGLEVLPDGQAILTSDLADTTAGRNIAALVRMGAKVPISSRATASVKETLLTDKHPAAKLNPEWIGKKVNIIQDDFRLKTFDFVSEEASKGNKTFFFREEKGEVEMDFDLKALTEDNWKVIIESENIKTMLAEALQAKEKELADTNAEKIASDVKEQVAEHLKTPEFAAMFEAVQKGKQVECKACKAMIAEEAKFCSACGIEIKVEDEKPVSKEGQNEAIVELTKKFDELTKAFTSVKEENERLTKKDQATEEKIKIDAFIEENLKGKASVLTEAVRKDLSSRVLSEENMEETLKDCIQRAEGLFATMGIDPNKLPQGTGVKMDDPKDGKGKLNEEQKFQVGLLGAI